MGGYVPQAGPLHNIYARRFFRFYSPIRIHYSPANLFLTTLVPIIEVMKFFTVASFCLLIIGATTVNAATDAEKACGFTKKVGTPCVLKLDGGHTLTGSKSHILK